MLCAREARPNVGSAMYGIAQKRGIKLVKSEKHLWNLWKNGNQLQLPVFSGAKKGLTRIRKTFHHDHGK